MFKIEAIGNLGGDAEVKNDNGRMYVQFSVADTRKFTKEDGTKQEITNWISCFYRNADSEVVKYLKKGVRVFVRGNGDLRLFSSAKDRMMKAGASINVQEIELVGGSTDEIPRQLAMETGEVLPVYKAYFIDIRQIPEKDRPETLYDKHGLPYNVDKNGFVTVVQAPTDEQSNNTADNPEANADGSQAEIY